MMALELSVAAERGGPGPVVCFEGSQSRRRLFLRTYFVASMLIFRFGGANSSAARRTVVVVVRNFDDFHHLLVVVAVDWLFGHSFHLHLKFVLASLSSQWA